MYLEGSKGAERGQLFTTGPGTYKIPSCQDIPVDFRVGLLERAPNPKAIFSSKVSIYIDIIAGGGSFIVVVVVVVIFIVVVVVIILGCW